MSKRVNLIHVGIGLIGGTAIGILRTLRDSWESQFGIQIIHRAFIDTSGGVACDEPDGYSATTIDRLLAARAGGSKVTAAAPGIGLTPRTAEEALDIALSMGPCIVVDCGASSGTAGLSARAVGAGHGAVFSNKAPLALPWSDPRSQVLWSETHCGGRIRYETTCGAGLPVISTLRNLLDSGDAVIEVSGSLSGTFGAIFADLAGGAPLSAAVRGAKERGYTEPDPRDDLSGLDVARKALILSRTMGNPVDLDQIDVESLVPEHLAAVSVEDFLNGLTSEDAPVAARVATANRNGNALKYLARVSPEAGVSVGIGEAASSTILGSLQGPENIISFRTSRYDAYPLTITGPGAGAEVTAAGVVADILPLMRELGEG
jgi:homoserine dehydrogenase